ncbi:HpcH/HpaI aldolase/citrate lyase family protein [Chloroflexota bacterium]
MMDGTFKNKLNRGDLQIGTVMTLPSPEICEILCWSGFDWIFVDLEHSAMGVKDAQVILQAAAPRTPCAIRVPSIDENWIKKVLDIGPDGIIIPQVRTAEDVERVVQFCKYPPEGLRSVGIGRAHGYGGRFQEYVRTANDQTAIIIQIEHKDAVNNIEEITKVPGFDCLFIGPYDLSASMGKVGLVTDPDIQSAIRQVKTSADKAKIPLGIFGGTAQAVEPYIQRGYTLITVGQDVTLLGSAAKIITDTLK